MTNEILNNMENNIEETLIQCEVCKQWVTIAEIPNNNGCIYCLESLNLQ